MYSDGRSQAVANWLVVALATGRFGFFLPDATGCYWPEYVGRNRLAPAKSGLSKSRRTKKI